MSIVPCRLVIHGWRGQVRDPKQNATGIEGEDASIKSPHNKAVDRVR